jgi:hypothetical protein
MANLNGLISSRDVAATGAVNSNFFVRKGDAIPTPLTLLSPDGTRTASIDVANTSGNMTIAPDLSGARMRIGNGNNLFISPSAVANAQLVVEDDGDVGLYQGGGGTLFLGAAGSIAFQDLSTSPNLRVGSGQGRIYDSVYNKPVNITVLQAVPTVGNIAYDQTASFVAGLYQVQLTVETLTATGGATNFLEFACSAPPSSEVINFSSTQVSPGGVGTSLCMNSGFFTHAGGSLRVLMNATATPWTGSWTLQLVKLG